ncbi:MAG: ribosome maturation factor RimP [Porticoccaceae bacterium]
MKAGATQEKLAQLLAPVVTAMGCELWGIEFTASARHSTLRIYIDKEDGVLLEDCERVSRQVSSILDVEDPISTEYTLEVSSPGMDRPLYTLDHFSRYRGETVTIRLRVPYEGRRRYKGLLVGVEGDDVVVQCEGEEYLFPIDVIDKANVVPRFGPETQEADL